MVAIQVASMNSKFDTLQGKYDGMDDKLQHMTKLIEEELNAMDKVTELEEQAKVIDHVPPAGFAAVAVRIMLSIYGGYRCYNSCVKTRLILRLWSKCLAIRYEQLLLCV